jgi:hypothetical protein
VITFTPTQTFENMISNFLPTNGMSMSTIAVRDDDHIIWKEEEENGEDEDEKDDEKKQIDDYVMIESTTTRIAMLETLPMNMIMSSSSFPTTTLFDQVDSVEPASSLLFEHFELLDRISASSTIAGGMAVAQDDIELNWWDLNDEFILLSSTQNVPSSASTKSIITEDNPWILFNITSRPLATYVEPILHDVVVNNQKETDKSSSELNDNVDVDMNFDMNDYFHVSTMAMEDIARTNATHAILHDFTEFESKLDDESHAEFNEPLSTLIMPPFSWMLNQLTRTKSKASSITTLAKRMTTKATSKISTNLTTSCSPKSCKHGGRLNTDCRCSCLPAFNVDYCQIGR